MAVPEAADDRVAWSLPDRLREISGLALTTDERLLAVTDEEAIVYELDYETGRLVKAFALGSPTVRGDFEGIAVIKDDVWLMTSNGLLYRTREGDDGDRVEFERIETGLGDACELEGLTESANDRLLLLCKDARRGEPLSVFAWTDDAVSAIELPEDEMEARIDEKGLRPSGIDIDPETGDWLILAAVQHRLFRLSADAREIEDIIALEPNRHRQPEGIAITRDGRLIIADEGGRGRARLTVYRETGRE